MDILKLFFSIIDDDGMQGEVYVNCFSLTMHTPYPSTVLLQACTADCRITNTESALIECIAIQIGMR